MKTLVIGANGQIGRRFCELAAHAGLGVRAMVRDGTQAEYFERLGLESVVGNLEGEMGHAFSGCEQALFTAGSGPKTGPDRTLMVDLHGAVRAIDAAVDAGMDRFIMVSAWRARDPLQAPEKLRPFCAAKYAADRILRQAGVDHAILAPGRFTDEPATGLVTLDPDSVEGVDVSRGNVALALLEIARQTTLRNDTWPLLDGNVPVAAAFFRPA